MKSLAFFIFLILSSHLVSAQCYTSGSPIEYVWVNPAGTYVDLASKRPLDVTHHKIFDLTTGKFVKMWGPDKSFPVQPTDGYGFVNERETRYSQSDYYRNGMKGNTEYVSIGKNGQTMLHRQFGAYSRVSYDTSHGRGFIVEPTEGSSNRLWWIVEEGVPEMIDKKWKGAHAPYIFSPDGKYAVAAGRGTIIDMERRTVLKSGLIKNFSLAHTMISLDSKEVAFHAQNSNTGEHYLVVIDLATQKIVYKQQFTNDKDKFLFILPLPDMRRSILYMTNRSGNNDGPQNAWLITPKGPTPLCNPGWQREKDELEGKVTGAYDEVAKTGSGCPMEVAAMEAEGKWTLSVGAGSGTLYLSARASGDVSGNYSYTTGGNIKNGRLSGKLSATKSGTACTHTITASYDESLFGGSKGTITLTLSADGKSLSGNVNGTTWKGQKN